MVQRVNTFRLRQTGHHFADSILKFILLYESLHILIEISLKCIPKVPIYNKSVLVQEIAWSLMDDTHMGS